MRLLLLLVIAVSVCAAETPPLPEPYRSIVALARAAPPELAADAMLRVLESGQVADKDSARDLAEQAFQLAASAHFPIRRRAFAGSLTDTRQGYVNEANALKLDTLSLQSRAARDLLPFDKQRARELFLQIPKPALAPLTCDDALVYDVSDFYQTLGLVVQNSFSEKERKREDHVSLLIDYVSGATSSAQFAPLARAIESVALTAGQREAVLARYNTMLESVSGDDRSFSASLNDLSRAVVPEMAASFKKYEERNLSGARCEDSLPLTRFAQDGKPADQVLGRAKLDQYWQSARAKQLLQDGTRLRYGPGGAGLTEADRAKPEWQQQLTDYLAELAGWSASDEASDADYYHEKCVVYLALLDLIPQGQAREKMLYAFAGFVAASDLQGQSPAEWFVHANTLRERMRANPAEVTRVIETYGNSGNAALALFASLARTFAADPPAWVAEAAASSR